MRYLEALAAGVIAAVRVGRKLAVREDENEVVEIIDAFLGAADDVLKPEQAQSNGG